MILIADSGSTKTDWRLWNPESNEMLELNTKGLNPYFVDAKEITSVVESQIPANLLNQVLEIYFYGSGCSSEKSIKTVFEGLYKACPQADIKVEHDLMAAARALFGNKPGIACILGTGSNACYFNGLEIEEEAISFGFIMGDEGAGNHLGRLLLKGIFSKKAPQDIQEKFQETYPDLDLSGLLRQLYHMPSPNRFLAGFSPFIIENKNHKYIKEIILRSFEQFYDEFVLDFDKPSSTKIGFQGSIAHFYKDEISEVFKSKGFSSFRFLKKPIEGLIDYHFANS